MYGDIGSFIHDFHDAMFYCGMRIILGRLRFLVPRKKMEKAFKSSHDFLDFYISKAFAEKDIGHHESTAGTSLLQGLVQQTDDRTDIRNQMIQNLMASSDTISILLSNTLFLLSRHPEIWKDLRAVVLSSFKDDELTIESLNSARLIRNVLFEGKFVPLGCLVSIFCFTLD
jgi:cytochrome P450